MQDVNSAENNYNRVIQQQDMNVSDLGVCDERDWDHENADDKLIGWDGDGCEFCNRL